SVNEDRFEDEQMPERRASALDNKDAQTGSAIGHSKLQRWVDLIAALLARSLPASFADIAQSVPAYAVRLAAFEDENDERRRETLEQSLKRTFERDKDE